MWEIQILWGGRSSQWITVERGFKSRDDAEWATAEWKQRNNCRGDPFRAVPTPSLDVLPAKEVDAALAAQ